MGSKGCSALIVAHGGVKEVVDDSIIYCGLFSFVQSDKDDSRIIRVSQHTYM